MIFSVTVHALHHRLLELRYCKSSNIGLYQVYVIICTPHLHSQIYFSPPTQRQSICLMYSNFVVAYLHLTLATINLKLVIGQCLSINLLGTYSCVNTPCTSYFDWYVVLIFTDEPMKDAKPMLSKCYALSVNTIAELALSPDHLSVYIDSWVFVCKIIFSMLLNDVFVPSLCLLIFCFLLNWSMFPIGLLVYHLILNSRLFPHFWISVTRIPVSYTL